MPGTGREAGVTLGEPAVYRISIVGRLDPALSNRLADMRIEPGESEGGHRAGVTTLVGRLADQAQLAGVLNFLFERRLPILSVETLSDEDYS